MKDYSCTPLHTNFKMQIIQFRPATTLYKVYSECEQSEYELKQTSTSIRVKTVLHGVDFAGLRFNAWSPSYKTHFFSGSCTIAFSPVAPKKSIVRKEIPRVNILKYTTQHIKIYYSK